jgi:hypothetical protein
MKRLPLLCASRHSEAAFSAQTVAATERDQDDLGELGVVE